MRFSFPAELALWVLMSLLLLLVTFTSIRNLERGGPRSLRTPDTQAVVPVPEPAPDIATHMVQEGPDRTSKRIWPVSAATSWPIPGPSF
jgi:hypothetical protein